MKTYTILNTDTGEMVEHIAHKGRPLTVDGQEIPDPRPMAPPVGYKKQPSMADQIRDMVRSERLAQEAAEMGGESFEEANDFDTGEDDDLNTIYEIGEGTADIDLLNRLTGRSASAGDESRAAAEPKEPKAPSPSKKKLAGKAPEPSEEDSETED